MGVYDFFREQQARADQEAGLVGQGIDADREYAGLLRREWNDYRNTFLPIRNELLASYDNPADRRRLQGEATDFVDRSFDSAEGQFRRRTAGLGVTLRPGEEASFQRQQNLGRGLSTVQALNSVSRRLRDRDASLLSGVSAPNSSSIKV